MRVYSIRKINTPLGCFVLGILFIALGVFIGVVLAGKVAEMRERCTADVQGIVTSVYEKRDSDDKLEYEYTIDFEVNGKKYQKECTLSISMVKGEAVNLKYDPDDPDTNYLADHYTDPNMTRIFGGVFGVAGVIAVLVGISKKKRGY